MSMLEGPKTEPKPTGYWYRIARSNFGNFRIERTTKYVHELKVGAKKLANWQPVNPAELYSTADEALGSLNTRYGTEGIENLAQPIEEWEHYPILETNTPK